MEAIIAQADRIRSLELQSTLTKVNEPDVRVQPDREPEPRYGSSGSSLLPYVQFAPSATYTAGSEYSLALEPFSAGSPTPAEAITIPPLRSPSHHGHSARFTLNIRQLIPPLWAIIVSKALQTSFPVREGRLDVEHDIDEETYKVVLRIYAAASAAQTIAFWDSLAIELDRWLARLVPAERLIFLNDMGLRFHWKVNV